MRNPFARRCQRCQCRRLRGIVDWHERGVEEGEGEGVERDTREEEVERKAVEGEASQLAG